MGLFLPQKFTRENLLFGRLRKFVPIVLSAKVYIRGNVHFARQQMFISVKMYFFSIHEKWFDKKVEITKKHERIIWLTLNANASEFFSEGLPRKFVRAKPLLVARKSFYLRDFLRDFL